MRTRSSVFAATLLAALTLTTSLVAQQAAKTEEKAKAEEKKWYVNAPPGEAATVSIDTRTGTWMSVDVSPDGNTLVFDLLGDLYTLPIAGGEATSLTHGDRLGHAGALLARRQAHRLPERRRGRRQRLGDGRGRHEPGAGDERGLPPGQQPRLAPERRVHRRAQALHRHAQPRLGRDLALPHGAAARASRSTRSRTGRRTSASRPSRPTAATSTSRRTRRRAGRSSTTATRAARST